MAFDTSQKTRFTFATVLGAKIPCLQRKPRGICTVCGGVDGINPNILAIVKKNGLTFGMFSVLVLTIKATDHFFHIMEKQVSYM